MCVMPLAKSVELCWDSYACFRYCSILQYVVCDYNRRKETKVSSLVPKDELLQSAQTERIAFSSFSKPWVERMRDLVDSLKL